MASIVDGLMSRIKGEPKEESFELVETLSLPKDADPVALRFTDPVDTIRYEWMEKIYRRDADVFAAINHKVRTFMSSDYQIVAKDPTVQRWYEDFLNNASFSMILEESVLHQCIFGNSWVELVYNSNKKIVGFDVLDPKVMDFGRNQSGNILFDRYNNPRYYVQVLPQFSNLPESKQSRMVQHNNPYRGLEGNAIRLEPDEVAHFPLCTVGDNIEGVGLIEPMYNAVLNKIQIEKDWGLAMKKAASPLLVAKAGDQLHRPSKKAIDDLRDKCTDINSLAVLAMPYYDDVEYKSASIPSLEPNLDYYVNKIAAASGVPKPYINGTGDKTPRSTFKGLNLGYERDIMGMQKRNAYMWEKTVFKLLSEQYSLGEVPKLVFTHPSLEYLDAKADRLVSYAEAGLLAPDKEIRQIVRREERLPPELKNVKEPVPKKKGRNDGEP